MVMSDNQSRVWAFSGKRTGPAEAQQEQENEQKKADRPGVWGGGEAVNRRPEDGAKGRAKNHLAVKPHDAEVTLGPTLFYPLLAHWPGRLRRPHRRPGTLPRLARPVLPRLARVVPQGLPRPLPP